MRRRMPVIVSTIVAALSLCMLLVGCSAGGAGGGAKPADKSLFTGTWDLVRMSGDKPDDNLGEDDVELMRSMGFDVFLNLNEDDTMELALFGSTMRGSWKVKSAAEIEVTLEGQSVSATLSGEELTLSQEGTSMMFKKGKENKKAPDGTIGNPDESMANALTEAESDTDTIKPIEAVTIADDEHCTITVTGIGTDWSGDPGYAMTVTNKSDRAIDFNSKMGTFSVNGKMIDAYVYETIQPGKYVECFMYFSKSDLGGGTEALSSVEGTLYIYDDASYEDIAEYAFNM